MKTSIDQSLIQAQMQRLSRMAKAGGDAAITNPAEVNQTPQNNFGNVLSSAINKVNHYQQQSAMAATQVEAGDGGASLVKAVIASQKASVAFQATLQVRNKVVSAYQDIMNMPI
ncbi:flagellar hook-basal body complex protein FliE [Aliikangiella maris]|uniref:Flagellar hook-basal body complex protein FliE n=2 Tax=Aliikangiella maris TaxID=3162458 RepID=A0ABV2BT19_9GAMM